MRHWGLLGYAGTRCAGGDRRTACTVSGLMGRAYCVALPPRPRLACGWNVGRESTTDAGQVTIAQEGQHGGCVVCDGLQSVSGSVGDGCVGLTPVWRPEILMASQSRIVSCHLRYSPNGLRIVAATHRRGSSH